MSYTSLKEFRKLPFKIGPTYLVLALCCNYKSSTRRCDA